MANPTNIVVTAPTYDVGGTQGSYDALGHWVLSFTNPSSGMVETTMVRNIPTELTNWSWTDPYGPKDATFTFPAITLFDKVGAGDLAWCAPDSNVDLFFSGSLPAAYPYQFYRWEGYVDSFTYTPTGLAVTCKGAMYQLDNFKAKPEYLSRPMPYEYAIARQFYKTDRPSLRLADLVIQLPSFAPSYVQPAASTPKYLLPVAVHKGKQWTGLVTRNSGQWDDALTGYIQSILTSMYTQQGRYTLDLLPGRIPVLQHRNFGMNIEAGRTLICDPAQPGVVFDSVEQDYSQTATTVYGQAKSLQGLQYSGQEVYTDPTFGLRTLYAPLAEMRQTHARLGKADDWADTNKMVRELMLQVQDGLDPDQAMTVATSHLMRYTDPGITGQVTLKADLQFVTAVTTVQGVPQPASTAVLSRYLIRPGMTLFVPNLMGNIDGVLLHISNVECSGKDGSVTLTVDSKNRDALTVDEVRVRGRDSMSIQRQIIGGQYRPPVQDQLVPWDYSKGSGYIPSAPHKSCLSLFKNPNPAWSQDFPWTDFTTNRPPSDKSWTNCYIHIPPKSTNANNNWQEYTTPASAHAGIPIRFGQAGTIRLVEIAAYDSSGRVMKIPFHVSFFYSNGVNYTSMPKLNTTGKTVGSDGYGPGQYYPFFNAAWESYNIDGTLITGEIHVAKSTAGLVRAYGTRLAPAGYWPGSKAAGDKPTGLLVDETNWGWDISSLQDNANFNPYKSAAQQPANAPYLYCMIYADGQLAQDVYFLGRVYRVEPGGE